LSVAESGNTAALQSAAVANVNGGSANAGPGSPFVYVYVQNCLAKPRGQRSLEDNLRVTGTDAYTKQTDAYSKGTYKRSLGPDKNSLGADAYSLGTDAFSKGTDAYWKGTDKRSLGTDKNSLGTDAFSKGTDAYSKGTSKHDKGTSLGRFLSTSGKTLICPNGNKFKPANTVIKQFEDALVSGKYFQIRCKNCDKCPRKLQNWKLFTLLLP
jgi:hypothetical protein